jgi:hypothetical protein
LRRSATISPLEDQAMMNSKNVVAVLRRDVNYIMNVVVAVIFIGFGSLVVVATLLDLLPRHH